MDRLTVLQNLNAHHAPSGDEGDLASYLAELARPYADTCYVDTLGNLIIHKKGSGKRLLFASHMDSIGLIVTHIEKDGFLRVGTLGGVSLYSSLHTSFRFRNGTMGGLVLSEKVKERDMTTMDVYLDIGAKNQTEAEALVQLGDTAVSCSPAFSMGNRLCGPYLDNRISCLLLLEALCQLPPTDNDLYFVFTVQEEVGLRGAKTVAFALQPDYAIAVDVTTAQEADTRYQGSCVLGGGAGIKVMDASVLCHPHMVTLLTDLASAENIPVQRDIITQGGTDAGAIHASGNGVISGGITVPCRYIHSCVETVDEADVDACLRLILALARHKL